MMSRQTTPRGLALALLLLAATTAWAGPADPAAPAAPADRWVLIDTDRRQAQVYQGNTPIVLFDHIAIGSRGAASARLLGDRTTPKGEFRIDRINRASPFHIFLSLDYPRRAHAELALQQGLIDEPEYRSLIGRFNDRAAPPQDTVLGGYIGIHGVGRGDPLVHKWFDWTRGCVAVTNEQIEQLAELVGIGTRVVIR